MNVKDIAIAIAGRLPKLEAHPGEKVRVLATYDLADFGFDEIVNPDGTLEAHPGEKVRVLATVNLADFGFDEIVNPDGTIVEPSDSTDNEEVP